MSKQAQAQAHLSVPNISDNQYHIAKEFAHIIGDNIVEYYHKYAQEMGPGMLVINCDLSNQNIPEDASNNPEDASNNPEDASNNPEGLQAIYMSFHQLPNDAKMRIIRNYRDGKKNIIYYAISLKSRSFFFEKDLDANISIKDQKDKPKEE